MRTIAIIQARANNTRLPGKVFADLCGRTMLERVIERTVAAETIDDVVVAVPMGEAPLFTGVRPAVHVMAPVVPENDLIGRHYRVAVMRDADWIVRIPSDNPCVDPEEIDRIVKMAWLHAGNDEPDWLWMNTHCLAANGYPDGIGAEVYSMPLLRWLHRRSQHPHLREHPHAFFEMTGTYLTVTCPAEKAYPGLRLDVNTRDDLIFIRHLYENLPADFGVREVMTFLRKYSCDDLA